MTKKKHYNNFCNENDDLRYNSRKANNISDCIYYTDIKPKASIILIELTWR
jgi:hypothetical protein